MNYEKEIARYVIALDYIEQNCNIDTRNPHYRWVSQVLADMIYNKHATVNAAIVCIKNKLKGY